jgi:hypothetical protein
MPGCGLTEDTSDLTEVLQVGGQYTASLVGKTSELAEILHILRHDVLSPREKHFVLKNNTIDEDRDLPNPCRFGCEV